MTTECSSTFAKKNVCIGLYKKEEVQSVKIIKKEPLNCECTRQNSPFANFNDTLNDVYSVILVKSFGKIFNIFESISSFCGFPYSAPTL